MGEWKIIIDNYDTKFSERLSVKDSDLSNQVQNFDSWNK